MINVKLVDTLMDPVSNLNFDQGEPYSDPGRYKRLIGKLNYRIVTHPNTVFALSVVSQFLNSL